MTPPPPPWEDTNEDSYDVAPGPAFSPPPPPPPLGHPDATRTTPSWYREHEPLYREPEPPTHPDDEDDDGPHPAAPTPFVDPADRAPTAVREVPVTADPTPGLRVLVVGGSEPLGGMVAERLLLSGCHLAVQGLHLTRERMLEPPAGATHEVLQPVDMPGDRSDTDAVIRTVAGAEIALGGLDALVVLPAERLRPVSLDADAETWSDSWSAALATEVLAATSASHIAARSFLARRRHGRIVLVTPGRDESGSDLASGAVDAALTAVGHDLARQLGPHGVGVSVVAGGSDDFALAQVADVVEALLTTPVMSSVTTRIR